MPFKPNYRQQRADRTRAKEEKKQAKLQRQQEEVARRKAATGSATDSPGDPVADADKT